MPGPVRNQTDYSKYACYQEPDANESKANMSTARSDAPNASRELSQSSAKLAERASKPSAAVTVARMKLEAKAISTSSFEVKLSSESGDASVATKFSAPVKIDVRDINGDGVSEICVEGKVGDNPLEVCSGTDLPPPVEGARGASGDERSTGAGGSRGW